MSVDRSGRLFLALACAALLAGCNTAAVVGQDVAATGAAVTRVAHDVKGGL